MARAKSRVLALGLCNEWKLFATFTLNQEKYDRYDLKKWQKDFSQWIRNYRKKTGHEFKYILIPEHHMKDYAWHMHGLIMGLPWNSLEKFDPNFHPLKLVRKDFRYHNKIHHKFGFNSFGKIKSQEATTKYLLKYITKTMAQNNMNLGSHLYYASRGLEEPTIVAQGLYTEYLTHIDFENEYLATSWIDEKQLHLVEPYLL